MQMRFKIIAILFMMSISTCDFVTAQQQPAKKDSIHLYKEIQSYSEQKQDY